MRTALLLGVLMCLVVPSAAADRLGGGLVALVTAENDNAVLAVSMPDGRVLRRIAVATDPQNVAAKEEGPAVVVSAKGHSVTVLAWHSLRVLKTFQDFRNPHLAAITSDGKWSYVTDDASGELSVIDLTQLRVVAQLSVGLGAHHLTLRPDGRRLWVALGEHARRIVVVNTAKPERPSVVASFNPGFTAHDLAFSPDGRRVWVTSDVDSRVRVFSAKTARLLFTVPGGMPPQHLTFGQNGSAYITSGYGSAIEMVSTHNGRVLRRASSPYGSFNVTTLEGTVLTSSLLRGTVTEFDARLHLVRTVKVANATRDVAGSMWP